MNYYDVIFAQQKAKIDGKYFGEISDAINVLAGTETTYTPSEMAPAILSAIPTETALGNPIHITDAANYPAESVVTTLEPVQDLHGYSNPWPAGGGKNLLGITLTDLKSINTAGTWTDNIYTFLGNIYTILTNSEGYVTAIQIRGQYNGTGNYGIFHLTDKLNTSEYSGEILNGNYTPSPNYPDLRILWYDQSGTWSITSRDAGSGITIDYSGVHSSYPQFRISIFVFPVDLTSNSITFYPMLRLATVADPTFEPYSNICPISGHTGVELTRTGKNLLDVTSYAEWRPSYYEVNSDVLTLLRQDSLPWGEVGRPLVALSAGTYSISTSNAATIQVYNITTGTEITRGSNPTFTLTEGAIIGIKLFSNSYPFVVGHIQLELGSTATAYEPYQASDFPVTFPALGKNLCVGVEQGNLDNDASKVVSGVRVRTLNIIKINKNTDYAISAYTKVAGQSIVIAYQLWKYDTFGNNEKLYDSGWVQNPCIINYSDDCYATFSLRYSNGAIINYTDITAQFELGSTATTYEPYTNTAYGCEVDWVNGVLKINKGIYTIQNEVALVDTTTGKYATYNNIPNIKEVSHFATHDIVADRLPESSGSTSGVWGYYHARSTVVVTCPPETTNEKYVELMAGAQLVYPLATPIEIPLTPEVITLLKGENNVWTDSGESEIGYKVDLNSYIQKLIDEASAKASALSVSPLSLGKSAAVLADEEDSGEIKDVDEPVLYDEIKASADDEPAEDKKADEPAEEGEEAEELPVEDVESVDVVEDEPAEDKKADELVEKEVFEELAKTEKVEDIKETEEHEIKTEEHQSEVEEQESEVEE